MRHALLLVTVSLLIVSCSGARLSRSFARRQIAEIGSIRLSASAVEVRNIDQQGADLAVVETTIALAFQFMKPEQTKEWSVDAVRLGDRDWVNMSELMVALMNGNDTPRSNTRPPAASSGTTRIETFHINDTDFEKTRQALIEIGSSPSVPDAIEVRRIVSQNNVRAIAEASVSFGFQFKRDTNGDWKVEAARLGQQDWVHIDTVLATLTEGRRRDTESRLHKLVAGITNFRTQHGTLPKASNIIELTDVLHPIYMSELIRDDGWRQPIDYTVSGSTFRLVSRGPDGQFGTTDDVVVSGNAAPGA